MLPVYEARNIVLRHVVPGPKEVLPLSGLSGRVLAQPLVVSHDLPRFDCSAVDGYALHVADIVSATPEAPVSLRLEGRTAAGSQSTVAVAVGSAHRILTGAAVPPGAEAVVMQEWTTERNGGVLVQRPAVRGENIRQRGGEYREGATALASGTRVTPAGIGLIASLGIDRFPVHAHPRVAVVTTGNEVVEPGRELQPAQIYNANLWSVRGALAEMGLAPVFAAHVADNPDATRACLGDALGTADVVITTGGVSVGDTDHVKYQLRELGVELHFDTVAMKPGKPTCFGTAGARLVFGLPGNPAAVLVAFHHFVRPALRRWMGERLVGPVRITALLAKSLRKKRGRAEYVRGRFWSEGSAVHVEPTGGQDSHMLGGLANANCLIHFPLDQETIAEGSAVEVELL